MFGFGHKKESSVPTPASPEAPLANQEAWDQYAKAADAAKGPDELIVGNPEDVRAKVQASAQSIGETAVGAEPADNVVELPAPDAEAPEQAIGPDHQLPPTGVAS